MAWFHKKQQLKGIVLFRSTLPPRSEEFSPLQELGLQVRPAAAAEGEHWALELSHQLWGTARLACPRGTPPALPRFLIDVDPRLTREERELLPHARSAVTFTMEPRSGHILRDRKHFLSMANAICGGDGVAAIDSLSQTIWSAQAMQEELSHSADLDINGIFTYHAITEEDPADPEQPRVFWAHTHGLREIGRFDFDFILPSRDALGQRTDLMRAIAFSILEEEVALDGDPFQVVLRQTPIRFVSARRFLAQAQDAGAQKYRAAADDSHLDGHGVACEPQRSGLLSRLLRRSALRPSAIVSGDFPDGMLVHFPRSASELSADRARQTLSVFQQWKEEFAEFEPNCIAKLRFDTSAGGQEYPWFIVHAVTADSIDATCANAPYDIPGLQQHQRATHPLERICDWMIILPFGAMLSPRSMPMARTLRPLLPELRKAMQSAQTAPAPAS